MEVWDDDMVLGINGDEMRSCQFVMFASPRPEFLYNFPIGLKDYDTRGSIIHNHQMTWTIDRYPFRA